MGHISEGVTVTADFLRSTLARAVEALRASGTPYAIIGGFAAIARGCLRFTHDLDVAVAATAEDVDGLRLALTAEGFSHDNSTDRMELGDIALFRFWRPHDEVMVDVGVDLQVAPTAFFSSLVSRATPLDLFGCRVRVATTEDLIVLKMVSFRPLDRGDAIDLIALSNDLDWNYMKKWCGQLGVGPRLREVRAAAG